MKIATGIGNGVVALRQDFQLFAVLGLANHSPKELDEMKSISRV